MWATTRSGHDVEENPSWDSCLKVKRDLRRPDPLGSCEKGDDAGRGRDEDMLDLALERRELHKNQKLVENPLRKSLLNGESLPSKALSKRREHECSTYPVFLQSPQSLQGFNAPVAS